MGVRTRCSWEAAVPFCVQLEQAEQLAHGQRTSACLTPYKAGVEKENREKHSTINLGWQIKYGTEKLRYSFSVFKFNSDSVYPKNDRFQ